MTTENFMDRQQGRFIVVMGGELTEKEAGKRMIEGGQITRCIQ